MDFTLSEEQKMLQSTVRDYAANKLAPIADELDQAEKFPMKHFKEMAELGLVGMSLPLKYNGGGTSFISLAIALEEIARGCASSCDILNAHQMLCAQPIALYGSEEQKKKFLPPLASGDRIGSFAVTEPEAGSDISNINTTATRDGNDYIINGTKIFITNGDVCDTLVFFARIPQLEKRGMTAFIVEKDTPGFIKGKKFHKLGMRAGTAAELIFEDCRIPVANRLGEEGQGMKIALVTIDYGRIGIAAQGIGLAQAVLDHSSEYAKQRIQFGVPIGQNQAIAWMLADIAMKLEEARLLNYQTAYLADQGVPFSKQAAMAKLSASELAMNAATKGIQIFGGYGYMMDSPMQRYFRDAKLIEIYEGTSEVQRMVISRAILK